MFGCLALGYFLRIKGLWDDKFLAQLNGIVFKTFFPMYIFINIYRTDLKTALNIKMLVFMLAFLAAVTVTLWLLVPRLERDRKKQGVMIQAVFRSNILLFGIPITEQLCGSQYAGTAAVLVGVIVPIYNVLAVVVLEAFRGGKPDKRKMARGVLTNPLIIGSVLGIICLLTGLRLPTPVDKTISDMAKITTPLSLVILGGSFHFSQLRGNLRPLSFILVSKLLLAPGIGLGAALLLGFRGPELGVLLSMLTVPTAVSSFTMAQQMDGDAELAGQAVVFTALCSIATIFLWIFSFKQIGLF